MNNWKEMLDKRARLENHHIPFEDQPLMDIDLASELDTTRYQPWTIQRSRGRPVMFLDLQWIEPKTGTLVGCQVSYPHLVAVEYIGDQMVSLDFGSRKFVIEGTGLGELSRWLQQGLVQSIQEYAQSKWAEKPDGPIVKRIVRMEGAQ
jgi:hypothetical protein